MIPRAAGGVHKLDDGQNDEPVSLAAPSHQSIDSMKASLHSASRLTATTMPVAPVIALSHGGGKEAPSRSRPRHSRSS